LHANPQDDPLQVAVALAGGAGHGAHDEPQLAIELLETHWPEQICRDPSQLAARHWVPEQLKVSASGGQGAQVPAQMRWLASQVIPQLRPSQFAVLLAITGQGVHLAPQVAGAMVETQAPEQTWYPEAQAVAAQVVLEQAKVVALVVGQAAQAPPHAR
jgi:hypothetical protein